MAGGEENEVPLLRIFISWDLIKLIGSDRHQTGCPSLCVFFPSSLSADVGYSCVTCKTASASLLHYYAAFQGLNDKQATPVASLEGSQSCAQSGGAGRRNKVVMRHSQTSWFQEEGTLQWTKRDVLLWQPHVIGQEAWHSLSSPSTSAPERRRERERWGNRAGNMSNTSEIKRNMGQSTSSGGIASEFKFVRKEILCNREMSKN